MKAVLATGGTGGHLFPALIVAQELREQGHEVLFVGALGIGLHKVKDKGFQTFNLSAKGFVGKNIFKKMGSCFLMVNSIWDAKKLLDKIKPDVVLGFGGYPAFPVLVAAKILNIPSMIHEQNVVPGKANRLIAQWVNKVALSFADSESYFKRSSCVLTGCPTDIHKKILKRKECLDYFQLEYDHKTILVFGGSQGSKRVNEEFITAVIELVSEVTFQVIHLCGNEDPSIYQKNYSRLSIPCAVYKFLDRMDMAYGAADVIVARAGAATITEIAMAGKPAVLIPYPHADAHQYENACVLRNIGLAKVLLEKDLCPVELRKNILCYLKNSVEDDTIQRRIDSVFVNDSAKRIGVELLSLVS